MIPLELDVPECLQYRKLFSTFYSPTRVAERMPEYRELATRCLDAVIADGSCDIVDALTLRLPAIITLRDLGVAESLWPDIMDMIHAALLKSATEPKMALNAARLACLEVLSALDNRAQHGRDTFLGHLMHSGVDGGPLSDAEILSMAYVLLIGVDPTSTLTATALWHLANDTKLRSRLVNDRSAIGRATDEFLRWVTPIQGTTRIAATDVEVDGQCVSTGERAFLSWGAANRDETVFHTPAVVDIDRDATRHLAFGSGPHYCAGAPAARAMFQVMLSEVLDRIPDYRLAADAVDWFEDLSSIYGVRALRINY